MSEIVSIEHHRLELVSCVLETSRPVFRPHRFRYVTGCLALLIAVALLAAASNDDLAVDKLVDVLCCDGCCRTSLIQPKMPLSRPYSATSLHLSGSTDIDYTRNGHRVPLHMESALNELDHIERHVKLGLPKYLQESAAQREADLVDHNFERDLEGSSDKESSHPASERVLPTVPKLKTVNGIASKMSITQAVAEASRMEAGLRRKDREEEGRIIAPSSRELSRDHLEAEKEAADVSKFAKALVGSTDARKPQRKSKNSSSLAKSAASASRKIGPVAKLSKSKSGAESEVVKKSPQVKSAEPVEPVHEHSPSKIAEHVHSPSTLSSTQGKTSESHVIPGKDRRVAAENGLKSTASKVSPFPGSGVDPEEWARLQSIQSRIEKLIGGYTGGASQHSSFLKHFEHEDASAPPELSTQGGDESGAGSENIAASQSRSRGSSVSEQEGAVQLAEDEAARDKQAFLNL